MEQEILELSSTRIEKKTIGETKMGKPFYTFTAKLNPDAQNTKNFNWFVDENAKEIADSVSIGDTVNIRYTEKPSTIEGRPVTFRNILGIEKLEQEKVEVTEEKIGELPKQFDARTNDIHLQVCLKAAGYIYSGSKATPDEIAIYTKELFKQIWGN